MLGGDPASDAKNSLNAIPGVSEVSAALPIIRAYDQVTSSGGSKVDGLKAALAAARHKTQVGQMVDQATAAWKKNLHRKPFVLSAMRLLLQHPSMEELMLPVKQGMPPICPG